MPLNIVVFIFKISKSVKFAIYALNLSSYVNVLEFLAIDNDDKYLKNLEVNNGQ